MSFWADMKAIYRRVATIVRSRRQGSVETVKQITESGHGVDLTNRDVAIVSLADECFKEIYPKPNSIRLCNRISLMNAAVSLLSNVSFAVSVFVGVFFFANAMQALGHVLSGEVALTGYLADMVAYFMATSTAFALGSFTRKIDRDMTMHLCLGAAEDFRENNSELYYDRVLELDMARVQARREEDLQPLIELRDGLKDDLDSIWHTIKSLQDNEVGSVESRNASIEALQVRHNEISERHSAVEALIAEVEMRATNLADGVELKNILSRALPAAPTIAALESGTLDMEISALGEGARERLALLSESNKEKHEELMLRIGLEAPPAALMLPEAAREDEKEKEEADAIFEIRE